MDERKVTRMIFATVCYGEEFIDNFKELINEFAENHTVYVLTDKPELFYNCITDDYKTFTGRDEFSYFYKLLYTFYLVKKLKKRINYVDADFLSTNFDYSVVEDTDIIYTSALLDFKTLSEDILKTSQNIVYYADVLKQYGIDYMTIPYITEAFLSFPYSKRINDIYELALELQQVIEYNFNPDNVDWRGTYLERYTNYGIGFAEGTALVILVEKFKLKYQGVGRNEELFHDAWWDKEEE